MPRLSVCTLVLKVTSVIAQISAMAALIGAQPYIMAHRGCCADGAGGHAPENTIAAFAYAHSVGAAMFETDLRFTSDGGIVLMHDPTLDRTTNCSGAVSNWTLHDIVSKCDAGSWLGPEFAGEKVPTVYDMTAFLASSGMSVVLDLKERGLMAHIVSAAETTGGVDTAQLVAMINFLDDAADVVAHLSRSTILYNPNEEKHMLPSSVKGAQGSTFFGDLRERGIGVLYPDYEIGDVNFSISHERHPRAKLTLGGLGDAAARYGMQVWTWTMDTPRAWDEVTAAGARVLCTNDPAGALAYFRARQECIAGQCSANTLPSTTERPPIVVKRTAIAKKYEGLVSGIFPAGEARYPSGILIGKATRISQEGLQSKISAAFTLMLILLCVATSIAFVLFYKLRKAARLVTFALI